MSQKWMLICLKKKMGEKIYMCVFSVIQLRLLLGTALVMGYFQIIECSKFYNDDLKFLVIF